MFLDSLIFSINVMLPTFLLIFIGIFLRRKRILDEGFCNTASKLIFHFTLPSMIFLNMLKSTLDFSKELNLILAGGVGTLLIFFIAEWWAAKYIKTREYRCVFTQGTFRTNAIILGLALVGNAYGEVGIVPTTIYTAFLVVIYNSLGTITILNSINNERPNPLKLTKAIIKNPLILAIFVGIAFNKLAIDLPKPLMQTAEALSVMTLPMALICIGATIDFKALRQFRKQGQESELNRAVIYSSIVRLIIAPIFLFILGKWVFGLTPMQLGILFLTASAPVATAAYIMTQAYCGQGGQGKAAANLIGITTIGSIFTASLGLLILRQLGWI